MSGAPLTEAGRFRVPASHPCLPGHFPGHPIVPGALLLAETLALLAAALPGCRITGLATTRFTRPVLPGEEVIVAHGSPTAARLAFACTVVGTRAVHGVALLASGWARGPGEGAALPGPLPPGDQSPGPHLMFLGGEGDVGQLAHIPLSTEENGFQGSGPLAGGSGGGAPRGHTPAHCQERAA